MFLTVGAEFVSVGTAEALQEFVLVIGHGVWGDVEFASGCPNGMVAQETVEDDAFVERELHPITRAHILG